jgi:hypothetical protein
MDREKSISRPYVSGSNVSAHQQSWQYTGAVVSGENMHTIILSQLLQ